MRHLVRNVYAQRNQPRRATKRFFIFLLIVSLVIAIIFLLSQAFPMGISKAIEESMTAGRTGQEEGVFVSTKDDGKIRVIVDPGHGDTDVGTRGVTTDRLEKEVNLEIAQKLKIVLEQKGYVVIMTRESDEPIAAANEPDAKKRKAADMETRENIIREANADVFVSIHQNFFEKGSGAKGPQVFYRSEGEPGYDLAKQVQSALNEQLEITNPRSVNSGDYQLLRPGKQASVIVECGFFSNPEEELKLQKEEYQQEIAEAVGYGIEKYLSNNDAQ